MNIILGVEAFKPPLTGIGRYIFELTRSLQAIPETHHLQFYAWGKLSSNLNDFLSPLTLRDQTIRIRSLPGMSWLRQSYHWYDSWRTAKRFSKFPGSLYHATSFILRKTSLPSVVTIHDLSFVHYPKFHPKERVNFILRNLPATLNRADHIITDSEFVRQELVHLMGANPHKITAIRLGVNEKFYPLTQQLSEPVLKKYNLKFNQYLLATSTVEPRKNLQNLITGFLHLPDSLQRQFPLVLVGSKGWLSKNLHRSIMRLVAQGKIKSLGYLPENDMQAIYSGAKAFMMPSFYEGFGLPILEAMACGVPVLSSNHPSLAEVSGDAALTVDPHDHSAISAGLEKLCLDEKYCAKAKLSGLKMASRHSWAACAQKTLAIYKKCLV